MTMTWNFHRLTYKNLLFFSSQQKSSKLCKRMTVLAENIVKRREEKSAHLYSLKFQGTIPVSSHDSRNRKKKERTMCAFLSITQQISIKIELILWNYEDPIFV